MVEKDFSFLTNKEMIFGEGKAIKYFENCVKKYKSIILITGGESLKKNGWLLRAEELAEKEKIKLYIETVIGEPSVEIVDLLTSKYRSKNIECIAAVGGGSVIDTGKAVSAMLRCSDSVEEYLEGIGTKIHNGEKVPFIAMPTTAGTGSEATKNSVISKIGESGYKRSLRHDNFIPDTAVLDPALCLSCPKDITASTGMDALTQLIEAYLSPKANVITDMYCEKGIEYIAGNLEKAFDNDGNLEARGKVLLGAYFSGIALLNAGLGTVHGFASSIGGYFDIPHGVICGTLLHETIKKNIERLREEGNKAALAKYSICGYFFFQNKKEENDIDVGIALLLENLERLTKKFMLPYLSKYGIGENEIKKIVDSTDNKNNCVGLTKEDIESILRSRI